MAKFNPETANVRAHDREVKLILVEHDPSNFQIFCKPDADPENWHGVGDFTSFAQAKRRFQEFGGTFKKPAAPQKPAAPKNAKKMTKGEQIRQLLAEGVDVETIVGMVGTTANSVRWHKSKMAKG